MTEQKMQMELSFGTARAVYSVNRRQQRLNRAAWWFERMRQIVDRAFEWQPEPAGRPEQIWLAEAKPGVREEERQICE